MKKSFAERCVPYLFIAGTFLMLIVFMYFGRSSPRHVHSRLATSASKFLQ